MSYADVNGLHLYYEEHGAGQQTLVLLHGGLGATESLGTVLPVLAAGRRVVAVDLQAHGRTADIDRPLRFESMADDIAALIKHLGIGPAAVMGTSLGGSVALRTAIQYPDLINRLVVVSAPFRRSGWYPEILAGMAQMGPAIAEQMKQTYAYEMYSRIAPRVEDWPTLYTKMSDLLGQDYDWSDEVAALPMPTLVVAADADSFPPSHAAEFFTHLGGGQRDGGREGQLQRPDSQLAILPGTTHYTIFGQPELATMAITFLDK